VYFGLALQATTGPLVSNEQFALGGMETVRGYYEAEVLGDHGLRSTLELRSTNVGPKLFTALGLLQGFAFVDAGTVGLYDALPDQTSRFTVWSTGVGLQLATGPFTASVDWAVPLRNGSVTPCTPPDTTAPPCAPGTPPTIATRAGDDRVLFRAKYGF
jgi:hemolysin activation/secretion protein